MEGAAMNTTPTGSRNEVLIVGAGPVGLTLALELCRYGVQCKVIEKAAPRSKSESRATALHARSLELLEKHGIVPSLIQASRKLNGISIYSGGIRLGRAYFDGLASRYPFVLMLPQPVTEAILEKRLAQYGVKVSRKIEFLKLRQEKHQVIASVRQDGEISETQLLARFVVGCDGAKSVVRREIGLPFEGFELQGAYLMDCRMRWNRGSPEDDGQNYLSPGRDLILWQNPDEITRVIVSLHKSDPKFKQEKPTLELMQRFVDEEPSIGAKLYDPIWASAVMIRCQSVKQLRTDRVFLAGDAAHIHDPTGGQGMNIGMQDAVNLAWKLAYVLQGKASVDLLNSYGAERLPHIQSVLRYTARAEKLFSTTNRKIAWARDRLIEVFTQSGFFQALGRNAVSGLSVHYRKSVLVQERQGRLFSVFRAAFQPALGKPTLGAYLAFRFGGPSAGNRAPDASGLRSPDEPDQRSLHELLSMEKGFVLLLFSGMSISEQRLESLLAEARSLEDRFPGLVRAYLIQPPGIGSKTFRWIDENQEAHRRYGAHSEGCYLIRPDGYISFRSQPALVDGIRTHLEDVLGNQRLARTKNQEERHL